MHFVFTENTFNFFRNCKAESVKASLAKPLTGDDYTDLRLY